MGPSSADRIVADLRTWIEQAPAGTRLPSSRQLSERYAASPVTVQKATRMLAGLGLVEARPGAGTFVLGARTPRPLDFSWQTAALRSAASRPQLPSAILREQAPAAIALHSGYPDRELLPERAVRAALTRAARTESALTRSAPAGFPELQSWFAAELSGASPAGVTPVTARDVVVVPGTQPALGTVLRALAGPGQAVLMESPTYWGAILAAAHVGLQAVPVAGDAEGPDPDDLARAFAQTGARMLYAQPSFANPTGIQWSPERRKQVLSVVREAGAFLIEDDWARDFGIDSPPAPLAAYDDSGHVIYLRSLTKSISPAVRVGAVIARGPVRERILADRAAESLYVSGALQAAALDVVLQPAWRAHLRGLSARLRERRDLLARSVEESIPHASCETLPRGGLNLWIRLPDEADAEQLELDCQRQGVMVAAGAQWFPAEPSGQFLRLNYAGPDPSRFPEAAEIIGRALSEQLG